MAILQRLRDSLGLGRHDQHVPDPPSLARPAHVLSSTWTGDIVASTPPNWRDLDPDSWERAAPVVRGESFYQTALVQMFGGPRPEGHRHLVDVELVRDPSNRYDSNAVKALVLGQLVGHLRRDMAAVVAGKMDAQGIQTIVVAGEVVGAFRDGASYGVRIWERRVIRVDHGR